MFGRPHHLVNAWSNHPHPTSSHHPATCPLTPGAITFQRCMLYHLVNAWSNIRVLDLLSVDHVDQILALIAGSPLGPGLAAFSATCYIADSDDETAGAAAARIMRRLLLPLPRLESLRRLEVELLGDEGAAHDMRGDVDGGMVERMVEPLGWGTGGGQGEGARGLDVVIMMGFQWDDGGDIERVYVPLEQRYKGLAFGRLVG